VYVPLVRQTITLVEICHLQAALVETGSQRPAADLII